MKTLTLIDAIAQKWPDLKASKMQLLAYVAVNEGHCVSSVANMLNKSENNILLLARSLTREHRSRKGPGLISITKDKSDKRIRNLKLTKKGKEAYHLLAELNKPVNESSKKRDVETLEMF